MRTLSATEFKARCLALLDEVATTGEVITVLKHGKPVAQVVPAVARAGGSPQDGLAGSIEFMGDVISPVLDAHEWEAEAEGKIEE